MQLGMIGELRLLEEIRRRFSDPAQKGDSRIIVGIGDDAAAFTPPPETMLVTTDLMHEGIDFDLSYAPPFHLGFKLVSVNVSDIMAMGGKAAFLFLSMSMKGDTGEFFFHEFCDGVERALRQYDMALLGGDLSSARNDMVFSATVIGSGTRIITRGGAVPGDRIYVTSTLGEAACGLELLKRLAPESREMLRNALKYGGTPELRFTDAMAAEIDWKRAEPLIMRHLMPVARNMRELLPHITSMIDISDGLFMDLCRICDESGTGARVYLERIPMSGDMKFAAGSIGLSPLELALSGGEDYELLFTMAPAAAEGLHDIPAFCIGEITENERVTIDESGSKAVLKAEGYRHFGAA